MTADGTTPVDGRTRVELDLRIQRFNLPPVESALVIGRRASIGPHAMAKALEEMVPGTFRLIEVEHDTIEAVLVRTSHLRTLPEERLVPLLVARSSPLMEPSDMIHVRLDIVVCVSERMDV
ncbi:MAG: hypothetical protein R3B72_03885 [Polyangiaceae bacterium]